MRSCVRRLLDRLPPAAGNYAERWLRARGVTLLFSARVTRWPRGPARASHGGAQQQAAGSSGRGAEDDEDGGGALRTSCGTEVGCTWDLPELQVTRAQHHGIAGFLNPNPWSLPKPNCQNPTARRPLPKQVLADLVYDCTGGRCRGAHLYHSLRLRGVDSGGGDDDNGDDSGRGGGDRGGAGSESDESDEATGNPWLLHKRGIPVDDELKVGFARIPCAAFRQTRHAIRAAALAIWYGVQRSHTTCRTLARARAHTQVRGCTSVFACGDAMQSEFEKTAYTAELSAEMAARNAAALLLAPPTRKVRKDWGRAGVQEEGEGGWGG
jgi:hypothetical protein